MLLVLVCYVVKKSFGQRELEVTELYEMGDIGQRHHKYQTWSRSISRHAVVRRRVPASEFSGRLCRSTFVVTHLLTLLWLHLLLNYFILCNYPVQSNICALMQLTEQYFMCV